jgi:hypothetical protein
MLLVFALTLFVSATLLFLVEPMVGKMILPLLGGTPAVWNTCMVFFQAILLAGYAYAHISTASLGPRKQAVLHLVVLAIPLFFFPLSINRALLFDSQENPVFPLLLMLTVCVGVPLFVVCTSAPLLQKWFANTDHPAARDPYFLYGASNLGSMLALLGYPLVVEPMLRLRDQTIWWSVAYGVLALLTVGCAVLLWRSAPAPAEKEPAPQPAPPPQVPAARDSKPRGRGKRQDKVHPGRPPAPPPAPEPQAAPLSDNVTAARRLRWVLLAVVPSSLMLGATTYITTDIAAIPLLWVVPLALYLLSFILVFARLSAAVQSVLLAALVGGLFVGLGFYLHDPANYKGLPTLHNLRYIPWVLAVFSLALVLFRGPNLLHHTMILVLPLLLLLLVFLMLAGIKPPREIPIWLSITLHLSLLFVVSMVCHGELARDRPSTGHLTEYFLWMSVGGVVGGLFNALFAPLAFNAIAEYPLALVGAGLLLPPLGGPKESGWGRRADVVLALLLASVGGVLIGLRYTDHDLHLAELAHEPWGWELAGLLGAGALGVFLAARARKFETSSWFDFILPVSLLVLAAGLSGGVFSDAVEARVAAILAAGVLCVAMAIQAWPLKTEAWLNQVLPAVLLVLGLGLSWGLFSPGGTQPVAAALAATGTVAVVVIVRSWQGQADAWLKVVLPAALVVLALGLTLRLMSDLLGPWPQVVVLAVAGLLSVALAVWARPFQTNAWLNLLLPVALLGLVVGLGWELCADAVWPQLAAMLHRAPLAADASVADAAWPRIMALLAAGVLCLVLAASTRQFQTDAWLDLLLPAALLVLVIGLGWGLLSDAVWPRVQIVADKVHLPPNKLRLILALGLPAVLCYTFVERSLRFGLGIGALYLGSTICGGVQQGLLFQKRSFFGVLRVENTWERFNGERYDLRQLIHGTTLHGWQLVDEKYRHEPMTYYHRTGPIGQVFTAYNTDPHRPLAVIGLGTGTMACYALPGQHVTFYDIDPVVRDISFREVEPYFSYVNDARRRGAQLDLELGDARVMMERKQLAPEEKYRLLVIDAFSSDAIPMHLITWQALLVYLDHLDDHGILCFHISNRYLDLKPVLGNLAEVQGLTGVYEEDTSGGEVGKSSSTWVMLARHSEDLAALTGGAQTFNEVKKPLQAALGAAGCWPDFSGSRVGGLTFALGGTLEEAEWPWKALYVDPKVGVWTDDYSNLLSVFSWR